MLCLILRTCSSGCPRRFVIIRSSSTDGDASISAHTSWIIAFQHRLCSESPENGLTRSIMKLFFVIKFFISTKAWLRSVSDFGSLVHFVDVSVRGFNDSACGFSLLVNCAGPDPTDALDMSV